MEAKNDHSSVPVASNVAGLDRTKINSSGQVQLVSDSSTPSNSDLSTSSLTESEPSSPTSTPPGTKSSKAKRILLKTKEIIHGSSHDIISTAPILANASDTISNARLVKEPPVPEKHTIKDFFHHPASTIQSKVTGQGGQQIAGNLAAKEISHGADVELVRAQDEVEKSVTESQKEERKDAVEVLMRERQDMFVRWTMDRHVTNVRILPVGTVPRCSKGDFKVFDGDGKGKMDWEGWARHSLKYYAEKYGSHYIGYNSSPPKASKETLTPSIERLLVASAPFQTFIMSVRRIYRWESRNETLKFLLIFLVLWGFDVVFSGCFAAIIYYILHRRLFAPSIEDLRRDIKRVEDLNETAMTLTDFIEKKGDQNWVDPLLEEAGPWLMVQLADLANLMETLRNFYEWRVPSQTAKTLGLITVGLLVVSFTPIHLLVRSTTLMSGFVFFGLFPIGSRFPDYRLLVSPVKWLFWNIPTHAEWSVITLQAEGQRHRNAMLSPRNTTESQSADPDPMGYRQSPTDADKKPGNLEVTTDDYGSYDCFYDGKNGKLILNAIGVRFTSSIGHKEQFLLPYENVEKLEKIMRIVSKVVGQNSGEDLKIIGSDGVEYVIVNVKERDQIFSQIVGFSSVRWQVAW